MSHWEYGTIGEVLKKRRESKGVSLDEAASATNISIKFLTALEENQFGKLPGQIHITGFVRLYGHYLDLEENRLMEKLNRQLMMDEQPPLEEIMALSRQVQPKTKKINPLFFIFIGIILACVAVVAVVLNQGGKTTSGQQVSDPSEIWEKDILLKKGSVLRIPYENDQIVFKLIEVSSDMITLAPENEQGAIHYVRKNEYLRYDYNNDYFFDIELTVKNVQDSSALVSVKKLKELRLKDQDNYSIGMAAEIKQTAEGVSSGTAVTVSVKNLRDYPVLIWAVSTGKEGNEEMTRLASGKSLDIKVLENDMILVQSIDASDLSAIEFQMGDRVFTFEKAKGAAGYITFEMAENSGQKKLSWQAVY